MKIDAGDDVTITPAPPEYQQKALQLLLRAVAPRDCQRIVQQTLLAVAAGRRSLDGLLVARRGGQLIGAAWAEIQPGRTAGLWLPQLAGAEPPAIATALLARAADDLRDKHVRMAQALVDPDSQPTAEMFRSAGFEHLTDLLYLVSITGQSRAALVASELTFEPALPRNEARLTTMIEATYQNTLDCPRLNGVRDCSDVLAGYLATSHDDASHWYLARRGESDIGCLLLAHHAEMEMWEVVYMGLAPEARGHGLGIELTRHAQWLVRHAGGDRLVLAVDAQNEPAIKTYAAAGFVTFDRRRVFARFFDG